MSNGEGDQDEIEEKEILKNFELENSWTLKDLVGVVGYDNSE